MSRAGLVTRETHPEDARSSYAVLTAAGLARFRKAAPVYVAAIDQSLSDLSATELRTVRAVLRRVLEGHTSRAGRAR